jgi:hypothetical protein
MIIIVSGLPRSGTSMMMQMLQAGGLKILEDKSKEADDNNPNGYFEYELASKLPEGNDSWLEKAENKAVKVVSYYVQHLSPKHEYKVLFMERNIDEIVMSQRAIAIEDGKKVHKKEVKMMADYFNNHIKQTKQWISLQPNFGVLYLSYNSIIKDPNSAVSSINEFLELELDEEKMKKVVDKKLYKHKAK